MSAQERLLQRGRELLAELRAERQGWSRLDVEKSEGGEAGAVDRREADRLRLAWALQYGGQPGDGELLRYALEREVEWREQAPFQGIGETLEILASLAARDRRVEDVWVMARAKHANFDTGCGFDLRHLVAGGVAETLAHVRAASGRSEEERARALKLLLGEGAAPDASCDITAEALQAWHERKVQGYPGDPSAEPKSLWVDRAISVGERELAKELLREWASSCGEERDRDFLSSLAFRLEELGMHDEEATARDELLLALSTPFERAGERVRAAAAARRAQQGRRALDHLDHAALLHRPRAQWRELGLGRELVNESYLLAVDASSTGDLDVAGRAYALASEFAPQTPRLAPVTLEAQAKAEAQLGKK